MRVVIGVSVVLVRLLLWIVWVIVINVGVSSIVIIFGLLVLLRN